MELFKYFNEYNKIYHFLLLYFNEILKLDENNKLFFFINNNYINNDNIKIINISNINYIIKINKYNLFQSCVRHINNQSKNITFYYLDLLFNEYNIDIEKLINDNINNKNNNYFIHIILKFKKLNEELILSLEILKKTDNYFDINNIINKYITILL